MPKLCKRFIFILILFLVFAFTKETMAANTYFLWEKTEIDVPVFSSLEEYKDDYVLKLYVNGKLSNDFYVEYETNCSTFSTVLTNKIGRYTVYYKAYSKNNNLSSEQAIIFNVIDITAPKIELESDVIYVNKGKNLSDYNFYSVSDDTTKSEDIKIEVDDNNVMYNVLGTYNASITAIDKYGNITKESFNVSVIDNAPPKITIIKPLVFSYLEDVNLEEYLKCVDNNDNDITKLVKVIGLDTSVLGRKEVTFSVLDYSNNLLEFKVMIDVLDDIPPVINLKTSEVVLDIVHFFDYDEEFFISYLYNYSDNYSLPENITMKVDIKELIENVEDFNVYFIVMDEFGNKSSKTLNVKLREFVGPVIEGEDSITINLGEEIDLYSLVSIIDPYDLDVKNRLTIDDGGFDNGVSGSYTIKYTCFNTSGIFTEKVIIISVLGGDAEEDKNVIWIILGVFVAAAVAGVGVYIFIRKRRNN